MGVCDDMCVQEAEAAAEHRAGQDPGAAGAGGLEQQAAAERGEGE